MHTPEPWSYDESRTIYGRWNDAERAIADTFRTEPLDDTVALANTRRIVACVNACGRIPTEELETYSDGLTLRSTIDSWRSMAVRYRKRAETAEAAEREADKLREALRDAATLCAAWAAAPTDDAALRQQAENHVDEWLALADRLRELGELR